MQDFPQWMNAGARNAQVNHREGNFSSDSPAISWPDYAAATNTDTKVIDLIRQIVMGDDCLIVTGYQDLLSALSIIMEVRPGITHAAPNTIRLLFGTNTDNLRYLAGPRQHLPEHVRRHYMSQTGVFVRDTRDIRAIQARQAIKSGAIRIRVFDEKIAEQELGYYPGMMHAKLFVSEDFAATGSAGFSRRGLTGNVEFTDRLLNGFDAHSARIEAGEAFWQWGREWRTEALQILEHLIRPVDPEQAMARSLTGMSEFAPWRVETPAPKAGRDGVATMIYAASQTVYEHGFAYCEPPQGSSIPEIGKSLAATIAGTYDRCIMRDHSDEGRRQGSLALVARSSAAEWRDGKSASVRLLVEEDAAVDPSTLSRELELAASTVLEEPLRPGFAQAADSLPAIWAASIAPRRPGDRALEGALDRLRGAGAIHMTSGLATAIDALVEERSVERESEGSQSRKKVMDAAYLEALRASVGTVLCQADPPSAQHETVRAVVKRAQLVLTAGQKDGLKSISVQIQKLKSALGDRPDLAELVRELVGHLRISADVLIGHWHGGGLGQRFRDIEAGGSAGGAVEQGLFPMFEEMKSDADTPVSDMLEKAITGRAMKGLDKTRLRQIAECLSGLTGMVLPVPSREHVRQIGLVLSQEAPGSFVAVWPDEDIGLDATPNISAALAEVSGDARFILVATEDLEGSKLPNACGFVLLGVAAEPDVLPALLSQIGSAENGDLEHLCFDLPELIQGRAAQRETAFARIRMPGESGAAFETEHLEPGDIVETILSSFSEVKEKSPANLSGAMLGLKTQVSSETYARAAAGNPAGSWGAEYAILPSNHEFTAFFLAGKTGRRTEAFAPPRLLVVQTLDQEMDRVLRNQASCFSVLSDSFEAASAEDRNGPSPEMALGDLEVVSRHLSHLSHWDLRPERTVTPLKALSAFLGFEGRDPDFMAFGDLTLPSIELLCSRWLETIGDAWVALKTQPDGKLQTAEAACARFCEGPAWEVERARSDLKELLEALRFEDRDRSKGLQDRVSVIIRGAPRCAN